MPLIDQVQQEMVAAMKSGDAARLSALRMLKAALMKQKVDSPKPVDEAAEIQVLKNLIKPVSYTHLTLPTTERV